MKKLLLLFAVLLLAYLATGFYIVRGNEKAVVRRFGKVRATTTGSVFLQPSGLYLDLPWPFSQVDRVNVNKMQTITIGQAESDDIESGQFLQPTNALTQSQFLTGDKNILNVQVSVHYRISETNVADFLFGSDDPNRRLQFLAESVLTDVALQSGVDFVHTLGRTQLREILMRRIQRSALDQQLGLEVEDITIGSVYPPIQVKGQFLDVMNARADKETYIHEAQAYNEQRMADARGAKRQIRDAAEVYRQQTVETARGKAKTFVNLIDRFRRDENQSYAAARKMALQRKYIDVMERSLHRAAAKVLLDSGKPVDLTIFRDPKE